MWYERFNEYLLQVGFLKKKPIPNVYIKCFHHMFVNLGLYVDDYNISICNNISFLNTTKLELLKFSN